MAYSTDRIDSFIKTSKTMHQKQNMNLFSTILRVVIFFIILTNLTELSVEFCVDEVFEDRGIINMRRIRRGKSSSLGMPKAHQVNIQGDSSV